MPIYKCSKCGRTVEKPEGRYYCSKCGPSAVMVLEQVECSRGYIKSYVERVVGDIFGDNVEKLEFTGSFAGKSWKPFRPGSDVDVIVWLKDARKGSRDLSTVERTNPKLLNVCGHKIHFLIYPSSLTYSAMTTTHSSNPQTVEVKPKLSLSGLCHTLTLDEYDVLYDLDYFYRLYPGQYVSLIWLARKYQDRHEEKYGKRTYVLKECIDEVRRILERLWRKGMVQPEAITVKTYDRVVLVRPKTKEEAFKAEERWRITLAGHDCINPPEPVKECIKAEIEKEERETGKVTPMKAFCECWKKYET